MAPPKNPHVGQEVYWWRRRQGESRPFRIEGTIVDVSPCKRFIRVRNRTEKNHPVPVQTYDVNRVHARWEK